MIHQGVATTMVSFLLFYLSLQSRTLHSDYERIRDRGGTRSCERRSGISTRIELGFFVLPGPLILSRSSSSPHIGPWPAQEKFVVFPLKILCQDLKKDVRKDKRERMHDDALSFPLSWASRNVVTAQSHIML